MDPLFEGDGVNCADTPTGLLMDSGVDELGDDVLVMLWILELATSGIKMS